MLQQLTGPVILTEHRQFPWGRAHRQQLAPKKNSCWRASSTQSPHSASSSSLFFYRSVHFITYCLFHFLCFSTDTASYFVSLSFFTIWKHPFCPLATHTPWILWFSVHAQLLGLNGGEEEDHKKKEKKKEAGYRFFHGTPHCPKWLGFHPSCHAWPTLACAAVPIISPAFSIISGFTRFRHKWGPGPHIQ